jgi:hypothetical protein
MCGKLAILASAVRLSCYTDRALCIWPPGTVWNVSAAVCENTCSFLAKSDVSTAPHKNEPSKGTLHTMNFSDVDTTTMQTTSSSTAVVTKHTSSYGDVRLYITVTYQWI